MSRSPAEQRFYEDVVTIVSQIGHADKIRISPESPLSEIGLDDTSSQMVLDILGVRYPCLDLDTVEVGCARTFGEYYAGVARGISAPVGV